MHSHCNMWKDENGNQKRQDSDQKKEIKKKLEAQLIQFKEDH